MVRLLDQSPCDGIAVDVSQFLDSFVLGAQVEIIETPLPDMRMPLQ
jgi:hypothetical protein